MKEDLFLASLIVLTAIGLALDGWWQERKERQKAIKETTTTTEDGAE